MANTVQAKKRAKQAVKRRANNMAARSMMRTAIKKVRAALQTKNTELAKAAFQAAQPIVDRMARKGIIRSNTAARYKSRMNAQIKALTTAA